MSIHKAKYPSIPVLSDGANHENINYTKKYEKKYEKNEKVYQKMGHNREDSSKIRSNSKFDNETAVRIYNGKVESINNHKNYNNNTNYVKQYGSRDSDSHQTKYVKNNDENEGPYAKVEQKIFVEDDVVEKESSGIHFFDEEIMAREMVVGEIYDFNLGPMAFCDELDKRMKNKLKKNIKLQIIDNYYLYQYIFSIKDGVRSNYIDQEIDWKWNKDTKWYRRRIKRTYGDSISDLDSYRDYHAVIRIIRFQMMGSNRKLPEIFEVIIPRSDGNTPYSPPENFIDLLLQCNLKLLNFPKGVEFMIRRLVDSDE
jgi:hypothetical protein